MSPAADDGPGAVVIPFPGPAPVPDWPQERWDRIWAASDLEALKRGLPPELRLVR